MHRHRLFGEPLEEVQSAIDLYLGPKLIGKDPFDREQLLYEIDFPGNSCAKSGIDLALHDLLGKALEIPVCNLIGDSQRRQVLAVMEVAGGAPDGMARQCVEWVEQGVRGFKAKVGGIPERTRSACKRSVRRWDRRSCCAPTPTRAISPKEAIRLCRLCERRGVGLELLEQPVPKWDLAGMAQIRAAVDVLIEADEAAYTPHDVVQIARHQAADVINIKIGKAGGLYQSKKIAAVAEAAGLECVIGTAWGLGIKVAAKLHLAAATRSLRDGVEFIELMLHDMLLAGPQAADLAPPFSDGYLNVPLGPGLGVTLNEETTRSYELQTQLTPMDWAGAYTTRLLELDFLNWPEVDR